MTFMELCDSVKATRDEREALAYRLAAYRMQVTLQSLLPIPMEITRQKRSDERNEND